MDHRVEEVLDLGATDAEIAETLDIGLLMGGTDMSVMVVSCESAQADALAPDWQNWIDLTML